MSDAVRVQGFKRAGEAGVAFLQGESVIRIPWEGLPDVLEAVNDLQDATYPKADAGALAGVDFASDTGAELAARFGLSAADFSDRKPSGATGYTADDVRAVAEEAAEEPAPEEAEGSEEPEEAEEEEAEPEEAEEEETPP